MLIVIDWGTTNFRAILLDNNFQQIDSIINNRGILHFQQNEFHDFLLKTLASWLENLQNSTIIMSGMVGSMNGWIETEYLTCPIDLTSLSKKLLKVSSSEHPIYIVPGIKVVKKNFIDIMRGEEVQILGALELLSQNSAVFVLPGTHSKWVKVKDKKIYTFRTNMTGELFSTISKHTILSKSICSTKIDAKAFLQGVAFSKQKGGVLNHIFQIRTQAKEIQNTSTYSFLSGILIGHEIKDMSSIFDTKHIVLVGSSLLNSLYVQALQEYKIQANTICSNHATQNAIVEIYKNSLH